MRWLGWFASFFVACACEETAGPDPTADASTADATVQPPSGTVALELTPATLTVRTNGIVPGSGTFVLEAIKDDGSREDVTAIANWSLADSSLGTLRGGVFSSAGFGGETTATARLGGLSATATVIVVIERVVLVPPGNGPAIPSQPTTIFEGAPDDPRRAPELVYPNNGTLLPPNLGSLEVHFRPGRGNDLFEVSFSSNLLELRAYVRCAPLADGCLYAPAADVWQALAETHRGRGPLKLKIRGTDDAGTGRGASSEFELSVAATPVQGGLYYWTTSNNTAIMRVDFGEGQAPERFFPFQGGGCYGCHAVSPDGRLMSLSQNGQRDGRISLIDIAARSVIVGPADDRREQFQSWAPTSDRFVGAYGDDNPPDTRLRIRDGRTSQILETIELGFEPSHPDWSPRGDRIVFTRVTHHYTSQRPGRGGISYVEAMPGGGWSAPRELIAPADGLNRYYPAYAPSAEFLLYCESTCPQGQIYEGSCDGDADPSAKLWALNESGRTTLLERVNAPGVADANPDALANTFPKWAPFTDPRHRDGSGRVMWFTFSSRRQYGLRSPVGSNQLLWMAAIDPDVILNGGDGSFPAFALPFQDLLTSNHIAQWTRRIVPPTNVDGGLDPGADGGECVELGDTCAIGADSCCDGLTCVENGPGIYVCRPQL